MSKIIEFEVVANYPDMVFSIGDVVKCYIGGATYLTAESKGDPMDFPALFKPLNPSPTDNTTNK